MYIQVSYQNNKVWFVFFINRVHKRSEVKYLLKYVDSNHHKKRAAAVLVESRENYGIVMIRNFDHANRLMLGLSLSAVVCNTFPLLLTKSRTQQRRHW